MATLEELKKKREQLNARIQQVEAREKKVQRKDEAKAKILIGAAILNKLKANDQITIRGRDDLLKMMAEFTSRANDDTAIKNTVDKFLQPPAQQEKP